MDSLPPNPPWVLVWADEFNGTAIDPGRWNVPNQPRERGIWKPENATVHDGALHLRITPKDGKFTSAEVDTRKKFERAGGYYEIRAKLGKVPGSRPAFWITSDSVNTVGDEGRDGTEIDVLEQPSRDGRYYVNLHWDGYGKDHKTTGRPVLLEPGDWHTFAVWWGSDEYRFYADGKLVWATSAGGVSQVPEFLKIGVELPPVKEPARAYRDLVKAGGDDFVIDYVRVYARSTDLPGQSAK